MKDKSSAEWDTAIVLPLGVVAGQLGRIEAQLRSLNATAVRLADADDSHYALVADTQLDALLERLDCIVALVTDIQRDLQPRVSSAERLSTAPKLPPARSAERAIGLPGDEHVERSGRRPKNNHQDRDD